MFLRAVAATGCFLLAVLAATPSSPAVLNAADAAALPLDLAHAIHPRDTSITIELALSKEAGGQTNEAEQLLLEAARLDRQYLPAWSLANFYTRRNQAEQFWPWAKRASALCFDDFRPILRLAQRFEPDPVRLVTRLGAHPKLLRAFLDLLVAAQRWEDGRQIARILAARNDPEDRPRLIEFDRRLAQAQAVNRK